ncbi:Kinesin-like protein bimC [Ogataea parapolymorpha DL-1]|uniref:Kinesin-like protein n=1 Tax=Ogataea parapolymorpha (strain ATCC 26012 / BCRC 20466 / JCM 22074 / NRRL Y-7560 / DL-1) TaxID=871575 RepID=W1QI47_OGAPD|nr:Kinesin-like protein bimC [Ogataea parapolymorpha DL-1]ESX00109.1 Kinesin-like protein bimC [Ogataea parapolymorpha DL-1]
MSTESISVIVRCRGRNERELQMKSPVVVRIPDQPGANQVSVNTSQDFITSQVADTRVYTVDQAFGPAADQTVFFRDVGLPLVSEFLRGYNCTILAYGQTGSGKTYTMCGDISDKEPGREAGLVPRVLCKLFECVDDDFMIKCSFVEIYNEELKDLLGDTKNARLRIFERKNSSGNGIRIDGLEEHHIRKAGEGLELLKKGLERRQTAATKMNDLSSRSHTIFSITLIQKKTDSEYQYAKMNLVDLAGSENISRSGAINQRAKEAGSINQSLLTLGRVINALVDKSSYIPYRESKLTRLLQDSLGGKTKTVLVANISPAGVDTQATTSTLEYATKAKDIRNTAQIGPLISDKVLLKELVDENYRLKLDLKATRNKEGVYLNESNYNELMINYKNLTSETEELRRQNELLTMQANENTHLLEDERKEKLKSIQSMKVMEERLSQLESALESQRSREMNVIKLTQQVIEHCNQESEEMIKSQNRYQKKLNEKLEELIMPVMQHVARSTQNDNDFGVTKLAERISEQLQAIGKEQQLLTNRILEKTEELRSFRSELDKVFAELKNQLGLLRSGISESQNNDTKFDRYLRNVFDDKPIVRNVTTESEKMIEDMKSQLVSQFSQFSKKLTQTTIEMVLNSTREKISEEQTKWIRKNSTLAETLADRNAKVLSSVDQCATSLQSHLEANVGYLNYQKAKLANLNNSVAATNTDVAEQSEKQNKVLRSYASLQSSNKELESTMGQIKESLSNLHEVLPPLKSQKTVPGLPELQKLINQPLGESKNRKTPHSSPTKRALPQPSSEKRRHTQQSK